MYGLQRTPPILIFSALLCSCQSTLTDVGKAPELSPVATGSIIAPASIASEAFPASPVSPHSTWTDNASDLFLSKKAFQSGDILTVEINIDDKAQFSNKSNRSRTGNKSLGLTGTFDIGGAGTSGSADASLRNATDFSGNGGTARSESISLQIAAVVSSVLPNGNLIITGSQEVRVNAEARILSITGIVRPSDILPDNTINYERIAEARISYGGRGRITEMQQPAYGHQLADILSPL